MIASLLAVSGRYDKNFWQLVKRGGRWQCWSLTTIVTGASPLLGGSGSRYWYFDCGDNEVIFGFKEKKNWRHGRGGAKDLVS